MLTDNPAKRKALIPQIRSLEYSLQDPSVLIQAQGSRHIQISTTKKLQLVTATFITINYINSITNPQTTTISL